jgi:hypothetical protein
MAPQESWRAELISAIHKTGCRLDDAAAAADVAIRKYKDKRDALMVIGRRMGLTFQAIADHFHLDKAAVIRVVTLRTAIPPEPESTLPPAA